MPYYIIIRGPLGCGKSTIAQKLSNKLNAEYISIDKILEERGLDKVSPDEGCIPAKNFIKAQEHIIPEANEKLKNGKIVIFDACFYHKEAIEHLIKVLKYPHYVFTLKAPLTVCIERDKKRGKTHGEAAAHAVYGLVAKFDYGINIDISGTVEEAVEKIMRQLA